MKKTSLVAVAGGLLLAVALVRAAVVYNAYLVNQPALAYSKNFVLDLKTGGQNGRSIRSVAATAAYSVGTPSPTTFTDGSVATATFTVTSTSTLTGVQATAQITVDSTATLKNAVLFVNGVRLRSFYEWKVGASTGATATNIATVINRLAGLDASAAGNVVYATATTAGTAGNAFTLTKQAASGLTLSGATFSGGVDNAYVEIAGQRLTRGTDWAVGASTVATAGNIATAIRANSTLNALITVSTSASAVATLTMRAVGTAGNVALNTSPVAITRSGDALTSGTDSAWTINTAVIHKVNHGLYDAVAVLYTTGTVAIGGLTNATTYYASRIDADNFRLATSTSNAVAGTGIVLTSSSTAGPHTYTLTPLTIAGTYGFKWQTSDDNVTWTDATISGVAASSVTFATPYTSGTASWDFGVVGHRYLRVNESAGTAGAMNLQIAVTGNSD